MMHLRDVAGVAHEINAAYCEALGEEPKQPTWADAPNEIRASAILGVCLHIASPEMTPADSHAAWLANKINDGWKLGPVKDLEAKTHPALVPYDELPFETKAKDYLFRQTVHSLSKYLHPTERQNARLQAQAHLDRINGVTVEQPIADETDLANHPGWKEGDPLMENGPTLAEWAAARYMPSLYPPKGYAAKPYTPEEMAKLQAAYDSAHATDSGDLTDKAPPVAGATASE